MVVGGRKSGFLFTLSSPLPSSSSPGLSLSLPPRLLFPLSPSSLVYTITRPGKGRGKGLCALRSTRKRSFPSGQKDGRVHGPTERKREERGVWSSQVCPWTWSVCTADTDTDTHREDRMDVLPP